VIAYLRTTVHRAYARILFNTARIFAFEAKLRPYFLRASLYWNGICMLEPGSWTVLRHIR
jgi:hypothetical protein